MQGFWLFLIDYPAVLAALVTFALTAAWQLITKVLAPKPKLVWGITNDTVFLVPFKPQASDDDPDPVTQTNRFNARNIWMFNRGSAIAEDVELIFNWEPEHIERFPTLPATEHRLSDGRYILSIPRVNPKEGINFSLLSMNRDLPSLIYSRCNGHQAKQIPFRFDRQFPRVVYAALAAVMLLGVAAAVYLGISVIIYFAQISSALQIS